MESNEMGSFSEAMKEYKGQLAQGDIQEAYRGLMAFFRDLRSHFQKTYPDLSASGSMYYGYMDMTYFSLFPESMKRRKLKIAIVFLHEAFRFEVWLSGANRNVQAQVWSLVRESDWCKYQLASNPRTEDFVLAHVLIEDPDFEDLAALTGTIESGTLNFIKDLERFFSG